MNQSEQQTRLAHEQRVWHLLQLRELRRARSRDAREIAYHKEQARFYERLIQQARP